MRILVAEDDPALGSFVRKGLEAEHYAVDVSADGEQARAMAGELDFDLVVLDLNLPRLDGVSILLADAQAQHADLGVDGEDSGRRPRAVSRSGRRRLFRQTFLFYRALRSHSGADAEKPLARGISFDRR